MTDLAAAWRGEPITLSSPMPIEAARRWLGGDHVIRRSAAGLNSRNAWRPVLRGRLSPAGTGSSFVGVVGWDPVRKAFTVALLAAFACLVLAGSVTEVVHATGAALAVAAFGLFGLLVGLASIVAGFRETRGQTAYLRAWITGRMSAPWYRNHQGA